MRNHQNSRRGAFLVVLLALFISTAACGLPFAGSDNPPSSGTVVIPTSSQPSATPPAVITATAVAPATAVPASATAVPATATPLPAVPTATQPAPAVPTNTRAPAQLSEVTIHFIAVGDNGLSGPKIGCGDSLVAVKQPIEPTSGVIRAALNRMFSFKQQDVGESGLYNALWQSNLSIESARVDNGVATVYLTGQVKLGGECDTPRFKAQIEETILAQPGVTKANVFLNGIPIDQALSSQ